MRTMMFGGFQPLREGEGAGTTVAPPAGGAPAATVTVPWGNADGVFTVGDKPWTEALPEGPTRELMTAKAYKNPQQLADAYFGLNKLVSGTPGGVEALTNGDISAFVPKDDAPPEQIEAFYKKLGRPEAPDKYELKFEEGAQVDPTMVDFGKNLAFKLGLNPKQAQLMAGEWQGLVPKLNEAAVAAQREANTAEVAAVTAKWGGENALQANIEAGKRVTSSLGLDQGTLDKIEAGMGGAAMLDLFAKLGSMSGEKGLTTGNQGGGDPAPDAMTPQQAQQKIVALQGDVGFMDKYANAQHPEHKAALATMEALFKRAS